MEGFNLVFLISLLRTAIAFSPKNKIMAVGVSDKLRLYGVEKLDQLESPELKAPLLRQEGLITSLAFSSDGKTLAANGSGRVRFYDATVPHESIHLGSQRIDCRAKSSFSPGVQTVLVEGLASG